VSLRGGADAYDVIVADDTWMPEFTANGWLKPVTADLSGVIPSLAALSKGKDGQVVALPFAGNVEMFAYRTDLFQAAGLAAPKSWSDVVKAAEVLKAKDPNVAGVVFRGTKGNPIVTGFLPIFWAHGGEVIDGSGKAALASPAGLKALQQFLALKAMPRPGSRPTTPPRCATRCSRAAPRWRSRSGRPGCRRWTTPTSRRWSARSRSARPRARPRARRRCWASGRWRCRRARRMPRVRRSSWPS
jgi:hypothetical protein